MVTKTLLVVLSLFTVTSLPAAININFTAAGANTQVDITGSLNTTGLSFGTPLTYEVLNMQDHIELWATIGPGNYAFAPHGQVIPEWMDLDELAMSYSSVDGDTFGVNAYNVALPENYVSGSAFSLSFIIEGFTLEEINPQSGTILTLGNGDTVSVSGIPEPGYYAGIAGAAGLGFIAWRRFARR
ncbi:MAG: hypothetical protein ACQKBW_12300 [Puniceicoccales bacterium]